MSHGINCLLICRMVCKEQNHNRSRDPIDDSSIEIKFKKRYGNSGLIGSVTVYRNK